MIYKALRGKLPEYISELITPFCPKRPLRSAGEGMLSVTESRLRSKGDGATAGLASQLWNSLLLSIQSNDTGSAFKCLEIHFYRLVAWQLVSYIYLHNTALFTSNRLPVTCLSYFKATMHWFKHLNFCQHEQAIHHYTWIHTYDIHSYMNYHITAVCLHHPFKFQLTLMVTQTHITFLCKL